MDTKISYEVKIAFYIIFPQVVQWSIASTVHVKHCIHICLETCKDCQFVGMRVDGENVQGCHSIMVCSTSICNFTSVCVNVNVNAVFDGSSGYIGIEAYLVKRGLIAVEVYNSLVDLIIVIDPIISKNITRILLNLCGLEEGITIAKAAGPDVINIDIRRQRQNPEVRTCIKCTDAKNFRDTGREEQSFKGSTK